MVERCALSGSDLKIKFRTILITSIIEREFVATAILFTTIIRTTTYVSGV